MAERARLLLVDDDDAVVEFLLESLRDRYDVEGETRPERALERIARESFDVVISDVEMPGMRGPQLLAAILEIKPRQPILLVTAFGSVQLAVEMIRAGACDFVTKPFQVETLVVAIERALRERTMRREIVRLRRDLGSEGSAIVAKSPAMATALERARRAARSKATVLLTGESGAGKASVARWIHERSPRRDGAFVQVNCASLPADLIDVELFGFRQSAGLDRDSRPGLCVEASSGTLLLEDITELPLGSQAKLVQVLETSRVRPVDGGPSTEVDLRLVVSTRHDLEALVHGGRFRRDLLLLIDVVRIDVPPLRQRREDLPDLVQSLLSRASGDSVGITEDALRFLCDRDWPGNVRELQTVIERAVALSEHAAITVEDIRDQIKSRAGAPMLGDAVQRMLPLAEVELAYIKQIVARVGGNMAHAARVLGIDRRTLYRKLG